jgi:hypothetical protein
MEMIEVKKHMMIIIRIFARVIRRGWSALQEKFYGH